MLILRHCLSAALTLAGGAHAQAPGGDPATPPTPSASSAAAPLALSDGEVRKVDREQGKITLKHGPIASLEMPPMTMVFKVADPKMLDGLKAGDRVRFAADRVNGAITVTAMQPAAR
ncbi:copper-binding protein [Ideonella sp. DXS29W]|uniref:Copper-binding protein n=1 Tax=Ideonella lacteola TaxID=2984193 RepID=A0ABU9BJ30_9BURK